MEECCRLCREDPKYSLGKKLQIYMIRSSMDVIHSKRHASEFFGSLTDEERRIYDEEVAGMNLSKMFKKEVKKQTKKTRNLHEKVGGNV